MPGSSVVVNADIVRALTGEGVEFLVIGAVSEVYDVMIKNLASTNGSGKLYKVRNKDYRASAPGQFPVKDTGELQGSIVVEKGRTADQADIVISNAYALDLEFGTSRMQSRPFIKRSVDIAFSTRLPEIFGKFVKMMEDNPSIFQLLLKRYRDNFNRKRLARVRKRSAP